MRARVVPALVLVLAGCATGTADPPPVAGPATGPAPATATAEGVALPPVAAHVSYQLGGPYEPPAGATVVDRDHTVDPAPGTYGLCYVNAFQAETAAVDGWERDHPELLLRRDGRLVVDEQWDEPLLDTATPAHRTSLAEIIGAWIDECADRGYQGVELDNLDAAARSDGLLTDDDDLALAALLVTRAHTRGLAVAQKNAVELSDRGRTAGFDLAVAEECQAYDECEAYADVYGTALIEVEYTDGPSDAFDRACAVRGTTASVVLRDRDVTPPDDPAHVERWCP